MSVFLRTLMLIASIGAVVTTAQANDLGSTSRGTRGRPAVFAEAPAAPVRYTEVDREFYMDQEQIAYIRPGLTITINSITDVAPGKKPIAEVTFTDDFGSGLDRLGRTTPGTISASFVLAWYNPDTRVYTSWTTRTQTTPPSSPRPGVSAIQAGADSGGTWTDLGNGKYRYTFGTTMPASLDISKTHTLGVYGSRNVTAFIPGEIYAYDTTRDFRPDGQNVTATWDKLRDAACDSCHEDLTAHGTGGRSDVKVCVLCHQPQTVDPDTGRTQDMKVLIHKIHRGANLPSVQAGTPYVIIGNSQSVHDYSHVVLPQDIRNCDNCHENGNPTQKDVWYSKPNKAACFACHDNIDSTTGQGHPSFPANDDSTCASCHVPDSGNEFDTSIKGAHTIPEKSKQLKGINVAVVSQSDFAAGKKPTVVFKLTNNDGSAIDGSKLNSFSPMIAGTSESYSKYFRESGAARAVFDAATGNTSYTFTNAIPADAKGTWVISGDFYRNSTLKRNDGEADVSVREAAYNPIKYVSLTGGTPEPRRTVATDATCNSCHDRLALHGGQRMRIEECVICHNPKTTDAARRPADVKPDQSISMQLMIHRIHRGSQLTRDFTVYGNGNVAHNYNHVVYIGDLRNCTHCHVNGTQQLPGKGETVISPRDFFTPQGPGTAACLGCHDSQDAFAHAFINTTTFPGSTEPSEACAACHGPGKDHSVDESHAR